MPIRLASTFITIALFFTSSTYAAGLDGICPNNVAEALKSIDAHLQKGNWVNIDIESCQNLQSEIASSTKQYIESGTVRNLIPLMNTATMRVVRNTIYAIHGYIFKDKNLSEHFKKFSWYRPAISNPSNINLKDSEKEIVSLLKDIEENWINFCENCNTNVQFKPSKLPERVKIGKNKIIFQNKTMIDISPHTEPHWSNPKINEHISYSSNGIESWNSVLTCEYDDAREHGVDIVDIAKISLYSSQGKLISEITKNSSKNGEYLSTSSCPQQPKSNLNILISLADMGCCGDTNDVLIVFDKSLQPVSHADGRVFLLETMNQNEIYYLTVEEIYERSEQRTMDGNIYSLWKLDKNGNSQLLTKKTTELLYKDHWFYSYGEYQHINLYEQPKIFNTQYIATAIDQINDIVLFWFDDSTGKPDGTTIIPIPDRI